MIVTAAIVNSTDLSLAVMPILGITGNFAPLIDPVVNPVYQPLDITGLVITNGVAVLPYADPLPPTSIGINGQVYNYTLSPQPNLNQFTVINGNLTINLGHSNPNSTVTFVPAPADLPTTFVPLPFPDICYLWQLSGELSWTQTLEEQPSGSFSFVAHAKDRQSIINRFTGTDPIVIYGVGFIPSGNISIVEVSHEVSRVALIQVTVNLTGSHVKALETIITRASGGFKPTQNLDLDCQNVLPIGTVTPNFLSVQSLALAAGTSLSGANIYAPASLLDGATASTTLSSQLTPDRARLVNSFIDYNIPSSIYLTNWGSTPYWSLPDPRGNINTSVNSNVLGYYKLYDPPSRLTWGSESIDAIATGDTGNKWQPRTRVKTEVVEGDKDYSISPYPAPVKDLSVVFDINGQKKTRKLVTLIDGQPLREVYEEWGYVAVSKDNRVVNYDNSIYYNGQWQRVLLKVSDYNYDKLGYLTSVTSTGYGLTRYRSENPQNPETDAIRIAVSPNIPDAGEVAKLETYRFFDVPIYHSETYTIEPLKKYYKDIKAPQVDKPICLPTGEKLPRLVDDPTWIPPYYVKEKIVTETGFRSIKNPESTNLKPLPDLTSGKSTRFVERTEIVVSPHSPKSPLYQELYIQSTDNYNSQGAQFGNSLATSDSKTVKGRPPTATGLGSLIEKVKPPEDPDGTLIFQTSAAADAYIASKNKAAVAISTGIDPRYSGNSPAGSIDYPTAKTKQEAVGAAKLDLDIINTRNAEVDSFTTNFNPYIRPGDRVGYLGNTSRTRRVISSRNKLTIEGLSLNPHPYNFSIEPMVTSQGTEISAGREFSIGVSTFDIQIEVRTLTQ